MPSVTRRALGLVLAVSIPLGLASGCGGSDSPPPATTGTTVGAIPAGTPPTFDLTTGTVTHLHVEVLATHPHDDEAYTQGLVYAGPDRLYETTGRYKHSSLREVAIESGEVERKADLDDVYFGEGLALSDGRLIALTWKEHTALAFDPATFTQTDTFAYDTEGWGLCDDGTRLVMSDGTSTLTFRDQQTFAPTGSVQVTLDGRPQASLNELECVDGLVYANVYLTDEIVVIDPATGAVVSVVDAKGLLEPETADGLSQGEVLNGIAYDPDLAVFYITGKNWPELFTVRFVP